MNGQIILCVEDDKKVQALNKTEFEERGYEVRLAFTLAGAMEAISRETPSLIILDIGMPDGDGMNFLRKIRAGNGAVSKIPVLMLTGYGKDADIVAGFEYGCNDYLAKPYTFPVLFMRAKELLNRSARTADVITKGGLTLDKISSRAFLNGKDLLLKPKEFALLLLLAQNEGTVMSAECLYEKIWNAPPGSDKRTLQVHISSLRKKLESENSGYTVRNNYGEGYCMEKY
jgi:DNA-binding response OmpR family regulator